MEISLIYIKQCLNLLKGSQFYLQADQRWAICHWKKKVHKRLHKCLLKSILRSPQWSTISQCLSPARSSERKKPDSKPALKWEAKRRHLVSRRVKKEINHQSRSFHLDLVNSTTMIIIPVVNDYRFLGNEMGELMGAKTDLMI